jgi:hypothetical protein
MPTDDSRLDEQFTIDLKTEAENIPAWEMVEPGRYMPRRVRGSFPGRALG